MYNYALRMVGNADEGMDVMQDIFISVFRNLSSYRGEVSFKSWIFRIANYRVIEFYRRKKPMQSIDDQPDAPDEQELNAEQQMLSQRQGEQLVSAMQTLPLAQKAVVELKFFGEF